MNLLYGASHLEENLDSKQILTQVINNHRQSLGYGDGMGATICVTGPFHLPLMFELRSGVNAEVN